MRYSIVLTLLILLFSCQLEAKNNSMKTYVSASSSMFSPYKPIPSYKLGMRSFSYTSGLEHRFKLNNKLNFSLQYSLTYFNLNLEAISKKLASFNSKEISTGISTNLSYQIRKDACVITGFSLNKPVFSCFKTDAPSENPNARIINTNKRFEFQNINTWNPYFTIGFEKQFNLFKKNLTYSLQYNFGFMPYRNQFFIDQNSNLPKTYMQGITLGVKYKL